MSSASLEIIKKAAIESWVICGLASGFAVCVALVAGLLARVGAPLAVAASTLSSVGFLSIMGGLVIVLAVRLAVHIRFATGRRGKFERDGFVSALLSGLYAALMGLAVPLFGAVVAVWIAYLMMVQHRSFKASLKRLLAAMLVIQFDARDSDTVAGGGAAA